MGFLGLVAPFPLSVRCLYAHLHTTHRCRYQPSPQRCLPLGNRSPGCTADYADGRTLATRHLCDGDCLYLVEYSMDICVARLRPTADGLPSFGIPEGHLAFCIRSRWSDGADGYCL